MKARRSFLKKRPKNFYFVGRIFIRLGAERTKAADKTSALHISATANKSFLLLFFKKEDFFPSTLA